MSFFFHYIACSAKASECPPGLGRSVHVCCVGLPGSSHCMFHRGTCALGASSPLIQNMGQEEANGEKVRMMRWAGR